ncbi:MAG: hypothetical protein ACRDQU_09870 [Pseudonocardiaceae bacterium]
MTITTEQLAGIQKGPARIDPRWTDSSTFPPAGSLPKAAREPMEKLANLRDRMAAANTALSEARTAVEAARLADAAALLEHVRGGGKAAEFKPGMDKALKDLAYAQADVDMLSRLLTEQTYATIRAVQRLHEEGRVIADTAAEKAAARYNQAISELESARQDYLSAAGLIVFWRYMVEKGIAVTTGGHEIVLSRGPITKVDHTTIQLLRMDAATHDRARDVNL